LAAAVVAVVAVLVTAARSATAAAVAAVVLMYPRFYLPQIFLVGTLLLAPQVRQEAAQQALLLPEVVVELAAQAVSQAVQAVQVQYTRRLSAAVVAVVETKQVLPAEPEQAAVVLEQQVLHQQTLRILPDRAAVLQVVQLTPALREVQVQGVVLLPVALVLLVMPAARLNMAAPEVAALPVVTRLPGRVVAQSMVQVAAVQVVVQIAVTRLVMQELAA
jgi:hypothetical protein